MLQAGEWRVDAASGFICRDDTVRRLRPQVIDLLLALASRPAQVVSKQELADRAWDGRFIGDSVSTSTVAELREALEDDAREPRYVPDDPEARLSPRRTGARRRVGAPSR